MLSLRWKQNVDLKNNRIMLDKTKHKKRRVIYINKTLAEVFSGITRRIDTDLLFPGYTGDMVSIALKDFASIKAFQTSTGTICDTALLPTWQ
jgi:integrase